jgi:membrane protein DedA with SNARE-associated domain
MHQLFEYLANPAVAHSMAVLLLALLVVSGLGLPIPEDVPLLAAGYLCYLAELDPAPGGLRLWFMIPATFLAVLSADLLIYYLGRRYGHHLPRLPLLRRHLTAERLQKAQLSFHNHGGKTLFVARFIPGLRAPVFFSAGVFKIPFWKMLAFDGCAALISVPLLVSLAYYFGDKIDWVRHKVEQVQLGLGLFLLAVVIAFIVWRVRRKKRLASGA